LGYLVQSITTVDWSTALFQQNLCGIPPPLKLKAAWYKKPLFAGVILAAKACKYRFHVDPGTVPGFFSWRKHLLSSAFFEFFYKNA